MSVVSIEAGKCAVCRMQERSSMSLQQLKDQVKHFDNLGHARERIQAYAAAAEFFQEARAVELAIDARVEVLHG